MKFFVVVHFCVENVMRQFNKVNILYCCETFSKYFWFDVETLNLSKDTSGNRKINCISMLLNRKQPTCVFD